MRLAFMGTPDFAVPTLDALLEAGHEVVAVYTQPPRPAGRGKALLPSPVQRRAEAAGIEVRTPTTLRDPEAQAAFAALDLDVAVVAAYGLILPAPILEAPRHGCLNVHASLLPRWRGAAPIQRAILAGDEMTGVCIMQMERGLDTGPVFSTSATTALGKTAGELTAELASLGADAMVGVLDEFDAFTPQPQPEDGVTYAAKIDKVEARIDWDRPWNTVHDHMRGLAPFPGAWFELGKDRIKVLRSAKGEGSAAPGIVLDDRLTVACATGAVRIVELQKAGGKPMRAEDFLRGSAVKAGTRLA